jgi:clan AA aspartic protease (TIGR02281 family)
MVSAQRGWFVVMSKIARLSKLRFLLLCVASLLFIAFALLVVSALINASAGVAGLLTFLGAAITATLFVRSRSKALVPIDTTTKSIGLELPSLPSVKTPTSIVAEPGPSAKAPTPETIARDPRPDDSKDRPDKLNQWAIDRRPFDFEVRTRRRPVFQWALGLLVGLIVVGATLYVVPDMIYTNLGFQKRQQEAIERTFGQWTQRLAEFYYSFARLAKKQFARRRTGEPTYDDVISDLQSDEKSTIRKYADLLASDHCNKLAMQTLILELNTDLRFLETRVLGPTFLNQCVKDYSIAFPTVYSLFHSSKFENALNLLNQYASQERDSSQFASWQGFILEKLGRFDEAATEFQRALFFFEDMSEVGFDQFYYLTQALRAAGKYCDAARPLELFVSFDPGTRSTTQNESLIGELRRAGNCAVEAQGGDVAVRLRPSGGVFVVDAEVNGVKAVLVVDTGASTIHLTNAFSMRAGLPLRANNMIITRGVAGSRGDYLTKAETVSVGGVVARDVIVTVASNDNSSLGPGIDGLLGQTFLSRVKMSFNAATRTLTMGPRIGAPSDVRLTSKNDSKVEAGNPASVLAPSNAYRPNLAVPSAYSQQLIQTTKSWIDLVDRQKSDLYILRKYSPYTGPVDFRNVISLHCKAHNNPSLVIHVPIEVGPTSFTRSDSKTDVRVRFLINGSTAVSLVAEYIKGELFFDRTPRAADTFDSIADADEVVVEFGDKKDRLQFKFGRNVDGYWKEIAATTTYLSALGKLAYFDYASALRICLERSKVAAPR